MKSGSFRPMLTIGGNTRSLPGAIKERLFDGLPSGSLAELFIQIALNSSFDGLADLRHWRKKGILDDDVWNLVSSKLKL